MHVSIVLRPGPFFTTVKTKPPKKRTCFFPLSSRGRKWLLCGQYARASWANYLLSKYANALTLLWRESGKNQRRETKRVQTKRPVRC